MSLALTLQTDSHGDDEMLSLERTGMLMKPLETPGRTMTEKQQTLSVWFINHTMMITDICYQFML